jgi:hypothetical protein
MQAGIDARLQRITHPKHDDSLIHALAIERMTGCVLRHPEIEATNLQAMESISGTIVPLSCDRIVKEPN